MPETVFCPYLSSPVPPRIAGGSPQIAMIPCLGDKCGKFHVCAGNKTAERLDAIGMKMSDIHAELKRRFNPSL